MSAAWGCPGVALCPALRLLSEACQVLLGQPALGLSLHQMPSSCFKGSDLLSLTTTL